MADEAAELVEEWKRTLPKDATEKSDCARKDAEYYLGLRYPIELRELSPEEGGGWMATIPILGRYTFVGDGETPEEALESLEALRQELIPHLIARGVELPEPPEASLEEERYSGKFQVRIPRYLHARLAQAAEQNACSLNQYVTTLLSQGLSPRRPPDRK